MSHYPRYIMLWLLQHKCIEFVFFLRKQVNTISIFMCLYNDMFDIFMISTRWYEWAHRMNKRCYSHDRVRKISIDIEYLPIIDVNIFTELIFLIAVLWYLYKNWWLWSLSHWCIKMVEAFSRYACYWIYRYSSYPLTEAGDQLNWNCLWWLYWIRIE